MKKLLSLRQHLLNACPELKRNPDKLLTFVRNGSIQHTPRKGSLSHGQSYTATLVLTDFSGQFDTITIPILAWLRTNQPDRADIKAIDYEAEILDNDSVDLELRIDLTEDVIVTDNGDGTVTPTHLGEPIYVGDLPEPDDISEWGVANGL